MSLKRTDLATLQDIRKQLEHLSVIAWMISDSLELKGHEDTAGVELVAKNLSWDISGNAEKLEKMLAQHQPANGQPVEGAAA